MKWKLATAALLVVINVIASHMAYADATSVIVISGTDRQTKADATPVTKAACLKLLTGNSICSATAVATDGKNTLVISCNHCFAHQQRIGGQIPRAKYPIKCRLQTLDGKATYDATAIDGSEVSDIAVIVCGEKLTVCSIGPAEAITGSAFEYYGIGSTYKTGTVIEPRGGRIVGPKGSVTLSTAPLSGDSGAGIFSDGKLVGVVWGNDLKGEGLGTSVRYVRETLRNSSQLARDYPDLWSRDKQAGDMPKLPNVAPKPKDVTPPIKCPNGVCPIIPTQPRFPILRRLITGR